MPEGHDEAATAAAVTGEISPADTAPKVEEAGNSLPEDVNDADISEENQMPSKQQEEEIIKKKYGGLPLKKPPLISKDSERAFFDSADWALGKDGSQKSKGPLQALRPKLQPTPHTQARSRSAYAPADDDGEDGSNAEELNCSEKQGTILDGSTLHRPENEDQDQQRS